MSGIYDSARERFLCGDLSWRDDVIKAVLVTSAYTPDYVSDEFLSDIPNGARAAVSNALEAKTTTGGWATAPEIIWDTVPVGVESVGLVFISDTGDPATSPVVVYLDEDVTNLPLTANGARVTFLASEQTGLFRL